MDKFIIRPNDTFLPAHGEFFSAKLNATGRLYILEGRPKVGKTAVCFKMLHSVVAFAKQALRVHYFHFDQTLKYWIKEAEENGCQWLQSVHFERVDPESLSALLVQVRAVTAKGNLQVLVLDGVYHMLEYVFKPKYNLFLIDLMLLAADAHINLIVTERRNRPAVLPLSIMQSSQPILPEKWFIERPPYLGGEIVCFGDSRLLIY